MIEMVVKAIKVNTR